MKEYEIKTRLNYDNRPLEDDEELVPYFKNEADASNLKNPDSAFSFRIGSNRVTAVFTAFKKGIEADMARSQFYSYINDLNGHFHCSRCKSLEGLKEERDLENGSDELNPARNFEMIENAVRIVERLTNEAPQLLAAVVFHREGLTGKAFEEAMRVSHDRSAAIQNKLSLLLRWMMVEGYDTVDLNVRATKHDQYYRQVITEHLSEILDDLLEIN